MNPSLAISHINVLTFPESPWNFWTCEIFFHQTLRPSTHTHTHNRLTSFVRDYPEETFSHSHPSCSSDILYNFLHLLRSRASSLFNLRSWQSFSTSSLQVLWSSFWSGALYFILHAFLHPIVIIFFAAHALTIAACAAVIPVLCHLFLVNDLSLLVSSGTNCLNLFQPIRILANSTHRRSPYVL